MIIIPSVIRCKVVDKKRLLEMSVFGYSFPIYIAIYVLVKFVTGKMVAKTCVAR